MHADSTSPEPLCLQCQDIWPYATAINLAAALQVPFQMQVGENAPRGK